jgi:hypothetical protein
MEFSFEIKISFKTSVTLLEKAKKLYLKKILVALGLIIL